MKPWIGPSLAGLIALAVALAGCVPAPGPTRVAQETPGPQATPTPRQAPTGAATAAVEVVNHLAPPLRVNLQPFRDAGCSTDGTGSWSCPADSPIAAWGCTRLVEPPDLLGGLDPAASLLVCELVPEGKEGEDAEAVTAAVEREGYVYREGCMLPLFVRYVLWRDGRFDLIKTADDLRAAFAPVTSGDEALSLALAVSGLSAYYGLSVEPGYRYLTDRLEDTTVTEVGEGNYLVHLFAYQLCGCGPHTTSAVDLTVTADGQVVPAGRFPQFENPDEDSLCVD